MGDQGAVFSGGEKQRLSIARTVLKGAQVNLFDEPTNGLDAYNERKFINLMEKLKGQGKTTIIVTHNLSLAKYCDSVLYLHEGGRFEMGHHNALLGQENADYKKLYDAFLRNYKDAGPL